MSIEKKEKKDDSGFTQHFNRENAFRPVSPRHNAVNGEYVVSHDSSPGDKDAKEGNFGNYGYANSGGSAHGGGPHAPNPNVGSMPAGHINPMPGHNGPFNMPHPSYPRPYPYKDFYPRRYNEYQKDFVINKKRDDLNLNDAISFLDTVKNVFADEPSIYDNFLEVMRDYKHAKIDASGVVRAATTLFKGKPDILDGFNEFLPPEYKIDRFNRRRMRMDMLPPPGQRMTERFVPAHERMMDRPERMMERMHHERVVERPVLLERPAAKMEGKPGPWEGSQQAEEQTIALNFIKKVKLKLNNQKLYKDFIDALTNYQKTKDEQNLHKIKIILGDNKDLVDEFLTFMPKNEENALVEIKKVLENKNVYEEFLKAINLFNQRLMEGKELVFFLRAYIKDEKMVDAFRKHLGQQNTELFEVKNDKYVNADDLGGILGSYRIYRDKTFRSNQDSLSRQVLNHICYSFPLYASEEEDVQFKRSAYLETLYRLEDERYEIELLIERGESLIFSFEIFLNNRRIDTGEQKEEEKTEENAVSDDGKEAEDENTANTDTCTKDEETDEELDLSSLHMPAPLINEMILFIYGEKGEEIFEELISKPRVAMPVILRRMYKLIRYWKLELKEKEKIWKETNERAFYKALDFHLDFKATDKKFLNFRTFVKAMECDIRVQEMDTMRDTAVALYRQRYDEDTLADILQIRSGRYSTDTTARLRYFYLLLERLHEIRNEPFFGDLIEAIKGHLETPVPDFDERIRVLSKARAYKLSTIDKLLEKINKRESANDDMYDVCLSDRLVIKLKRQEDEYIDRYLSSTLDMAHIRDQVFLGRTLSKDPFVHVDNIKIRISKKTYRIKYEEDDVSYVFKKGYKREKA